jgi:hypothetical protein
MPIRGAVFYGRHRRLQRQRPWNSYVMLFTNVLVADMFLCAH